MYIYICIFMAQSYVLLLKPPFFLLRASNKRREIFDVVLPGHSVHVLNPNGIHGSVEEHLHHTTGVSS